MAATNLQGPSVRGAVAGTNVQPTARTTQSVYIQESRHTTASLTTLRYRYQDRLTDHFLLILCNADA